MEEKSSAATLSGVLRMGGFLIAGGALVGLSVGVYFLFNGTLFSSLIRISQHQAMGYFFSVFVPSFAILITIGYLLSTILGLKKTEFPNVAPICILSLTSIVLSALSIFYIISFLGGFLTLTALIKAYTKPTFKTLARKEAFFLVEVGAMFVASFAILYVLLWLISDHFPTYALGLYVSYSPRGLLLVGALSLLMFFAIPLLGSRGTNAGICGIIGLSMSTLSYLFVVQNQYFFSNSPAYFGIFMLAAGAVLALSGNLIYVELFLSEPPGIKELRTGITSSVLYEGDYCPYCGKTRRASSQNLCSQCGRSLMWTPYAPFCSSCGHLVPSDAQVCPHCRNDVRKKRDYFLKIDSQEQTIAEKLLEESKRKKSPMLKGLQRTAQAIKKAPKTVYKFFRRSRG